MPEATASKERPGDPGARAVTAVDEQGIVFHRRQAANARPDLVKWDIDCTRHVTAGELPWRSHVEDRRSATRVDGTNQFGCRHLESHVVDP
jgi:hypothetical protein